MKTRFIELFILVMLAIAPSYSQHIFYSQSLQKLYNTLPAICRVENSAVDTVVLCTGILSDITIPVVYCWDSYGVLEHMGYRFLQEDMDTVFHPAIIRFLERELLMLLAIDDLEQKLIVNRDNGLILLFNGVTPQKKFYRDKNGLPYLLQRISAMDIQFEDGRKYSANLTCKQGETLSFHFIADAELLSDMDKNERDKRLAAQLMHHHAKSTATIPHIPVCDNISLQPFRNSMYVCHGALFMIPQMNNNLYYWKINDEPNLVFSRDHTEESFSNAMLVPEVNDYTIHIIQKMYGGAECRYVMKSRDFHDYFSGDYDRYFGVEPPTGGKLAGTLILSDRNAGNIHLAHISIGIEELLKGGNMEMRLHSNIPIYNIETLFGEKK